MAEKRFLIASNNKHKIIEFGKIFENLGFELITPKDIGISADPVEDGETFEQNALIKAREFFKLSGIPTVADDSGLCVDALAGDPGVYSARYGGITDEKERLFFLLSKLEGKTDRSAYFTCAIACILDDKTEFTVRGNVYGSIIDAPKGECGFGYDPVFVPDGYDETFAQMPEQQKNRISHRAMALKAFAEKLKELY